MDGSCFNLLVFLYPVIFVFFEEVRNMNILYLFGLDPYHQEVYKRCTQNAPFAIL